MIPRSFSSGHHRLPKNVTLLFTGLHDLCLLLVGSNSKNGKKHAINCTGQISKKQMVIGRHCNVHFQRQSHTEDLDSSCKQTLARNTCKLIATSHQNTIDEGIEPKCSVCEHSNNCSLAHQRQKRRNRPIRSC